MQFKFKIQGYQTEAARAVTDVFEGQPKSDPLAYLRDLGRIVGKHGAQALTGFEAASQSETGYGNAPLALSPEALLRNVRCAQQSNQIMEPASLSTDIGGICLDVEIETGTGKTYVYIKTMFELIRLYGWSKFIVVVPPIAIREGVAKTFETTEQHFFEQYGKRIRYFVYNSDRLTELDRYAEDDGICCMIINMQAINTSMREGAKNKYARTIFEPQDDFQSRKLIDVIAANNPIVIQGEPQKMGGKAMQDGIRQFKSLFSLSFSATIPRDKKGNPLHNLVYELDTLDAYNQRLVKRIEVKGFELRHMRGTDGYLYLQDVIVSRNKPPVAVIEHKYLGASGKVIKQVHRFNVGDSIYDESGPTKLEVYRDYTIAPDGIYPDTEGQTACVRFLNGEVIYKGEVYGDSAEEDMRRVQIRETAEMKRDDIKAYDVFCGVDVGKEERCCRALAPDGETTLLSRGVAQDEGEISASPSRLAGLGRALVVAGRLSGSGSLVVALAREAGAGVARVPPRRFAKVAELSGEEKTDEPGALTLARLPVETPRQIDPVPDLGEEAGQARVLIRRRHDAARGRTRARDRPRGALDRCCPPPGRLLAGSASRALPALSLLARRGARGRKGLGPAAADAAAAMWEAARSQSAAMPGAEALELAVRLDAARVIELERLDGELTERIEGLCAGMPEVAALSTMSGVGAVCARTIALEVGDVSRFASAAKLAPCRGVGKCPKEPGGRRGKKRRGGRNRRIHDAVMESARIAARKPGPDLDYYEKKLAGDMNERQALHALATKRVSTMRAMLASMEPCRAA